MILNYPKECKGCVMITRPNIWCEVMEQSPQCPCTKCLVKVTCDTVGCEDYDKFFKSFFTAGVRI
jgi:hypothetical protein